MNSTVKPENDIAGTATQRPLLSRDFVLLVAGQGISLFGNVMLRFAMSMWVLDETGSATIFASVLAISIVPTILLSPFGGVLADRVNRRTIMVALDAISAVLVLASAIVFATTGFHIVAIATMQVLLAVLGAFETPTVQAALPQMFRQYGPATMRQGMAVINQVQQLSSLLPSFLGGVLYAMFGIRLMMIIAIASFAGAAALECFIRLSAPDRGDEELPTPLEDLKAGVRFLIKDRPNVFRLLLFAAALNFVLIGYSGVGFPYTIRTVLGFDATVYGIADGLIGVSGVAGAFIAGLFAAKLTMRWLPGLMATLTLAMVPQGIVFLLPVDAWTKLVVLIVFTCGTMVASCFTNLIAVPAIQLSTPEAMAGSDVHGRGREHVRPAARPDGVRLGLRPNAGRHRAVHHHRPVRRAHRADGSARQAVRGLTIGAHATSCRPAIIESPHEKARKRYLWPRSTPNHWSRCGKSNSMVRSPPRPRPRVGRSRPSASRSKSWRHSAVRLWCNAPRMAWNSPPPVRCSPATARPSPIGWSGRPVKSRIIGIIGLITCIWWPHRQSALLSRPVPWSSSVCSRTSS